MLVGGAFPPAEALEAADLEGDDQVVAPVDTDGREAKVHPQQDTEDELNDGPSDLVPVSAGSDPQPDLDSYGCLSNGWTLHA